MSWKRHEPSGDRGEAESGKHSTAEGKVVRGGGGKEAAGRRALRAFARTLRSGSALELERIDNVRVSNTFPVGLGLVYWWAGPTCEGPSGIDRLHCRPPISDAPLLDSQAPARQPRATKQVLSSDPTGGQEMEKIHLAS